MNRMFVQVLVVWVMAAWGQAPTAASSTMGAVTKIDADSKTLMLKTDAGAEVMVMMQPTVSYRRVAPGETDLRNAATIALSDIAVGDRVLARGRAENQMVSAALVVVMSQGDIAKKQAAEQADWEKRGVTGLVTGVAAGSVTVSSRTLAGNTQVVITPSANAVVRRYAPDSVKFSDAKPAKLADIKAGDQVRARGEKSADGTTMAAEEIVSGSFKTLAGVVLSIDAAAGQVQVRDLETKKPVTVKVNTDSSMRKLAPQVAQVIAVRVHPELAATLKGGPGGAPKGGAGGDLQQMLDRSPAVTLADLKNGDAIVVSSTVGAAADKVTAITLVAGVEPILTKPGTREMSLGSWDLGGGFGAQ
jgi:transcription antitermination factor NusG